MSEHPNPNNNRARAVRANLKALEADVQQFVADAESAGEPRIAKKAKRAFQCLALAHGFLDDAKDMLIQAGHLDDDDEIGGDDKPEKDPPPEPGVP